MSEKRFNVVCDQVLPLQGVEGDDWDEATARRAVEEAAALEAMKTAGEGKPWCLVAGEWLALLRNARARARRPLPARVTAPVEGTIAGADVDAEIALPADPVQALRLLQMQIRGYELPEALVNERVRLGIDAQYWLGKLAEGRVRPKKLRRPANADQALLWSRRGKLAMALVAEAGWPLLVRRLADRAWAACWLKTVCPPELGPTCDALVQALVAPINKVQECIDLGAGAEAWFRDQEAKEREGD